MDVVYECGPNCSCGPECVNRTSQNGLQYRLEVVDFLPWKLIRILSKSKFCPHIVLDIIHPLVKLTTQTTGVVVSCAGLQNNKQGLGGQIMGLHPCRSPHLWICWNYKAQWWQTGEYARQHVYFWTWHATNNVGYGRSSGKEVEISSCQELLMSSLFVTYSKLVVFICLLKCASSLYCIS